ncbi:hypothetical protein [Micromonospora sp. NPDC049679]|uniref:hypothetical protein n=1 Tax=Micromonospora sp. NPDC049679 TaxID=3155920 RepID=UPI0034057D30
MADQRRALVSAPPVAVGDVIRISEADYCYGRGELHLRVTHVPAGADLPGLEWINLLGVELRWDGTDGRHRQALIRVAALRVPRP